MITSRNKRVTLTVNASITKHDYIVASGIVISVTFSFCLVYIISIVVFKIRSGRKLNEELLNNEVCDNVEPIQSPSTIEEVK